MLDVIRRGTAKTSIDSSSPINQIVQKAMGPEGTKQIELHNQSLQKKKVVITKSIRFKVCVCIDLFNQPSMYNTLAQRATNIRKKIVIIDFVWYVY